MSLRVAMLVAAILVGLASGYTGMALARTDGAALFPTGIGADSCSTGDDRNAQHLLVERCFLP